MYSVRRRLTLVLAAGFALLFSSCGFVGSGRIEFTFLPKIESDVVVAKLEMPYGTPYEKTEQWSLTLDLLERGGIGHNVG